MKRTPTDKSGSATTSATVVQRLAFALKHGGAIADNLTDKGAQSILAQLRVGMEYAPAIAIGAGAFNAVDGLVCTAVRAMDYAGLHATDPSFPAEPTGDGLVDEDNPESWYLLGVLVGLELAGGAQ